MFSGEASTSSCVFRSLAATGMSKNMRTSEIRGSYVVAALVFFCCCRKLSMNDGRIDGRWTHFYHIFPTLLLVGWCCSNFHTKCEFFLLKVQMPKARWWCLSKSSSMKWNCSNMPKICLFFRHLKHTNEIYVALVILYLTYHEAWWTHNPRAFRGTSSRTSGKSLISICCM